MIEFKVTLDIRLRKKGNLEIRVKGKNNKKYIYRNFYKTNNYLDESCTVYFDLFKNIYLNILLWIGKYEKINKILNIELENMEKENELL